MGEVPAMPFTKRLMVIYQDRHAIGKFHKDAHMVEVCAEIAGKQTVIIAIHQVRFLERTAIDGTGK